MARLLKEVHLVRNSEEVHLLTNFKSSYEKTNLEHRARCLVAAFAVMHRGAEVSSGFRSSLVATEIFWKSSIREKFEVQLQKAADQGHGAAASALSDSGARGCHGVERQPARGVV